jgi:hypothetical protein
MVSTLVVKLTVKETKPTLAMPLVRAAAHAMPPALSHMHSSKII